MPHSNQCHEVNVVVTERKVQPISAQVLATNGLNAIHQSAALFTSREIFPAPLANHNNAEKFEQPWYDWKKIDGVENALDQNLSNDDSCKNSNNFSDTTGLAPIHLV